MHRARGGGGRYTDSPPQLLFDRGRVNRCRPFDNRLHNCLLVKPLTQADLLFGVGITVGNRNQRRPIQKCMGNTIDHVGCARSAG